jgi:XTP/dITP diphosphohydrolase
MLAGIDVELRSLEDYPDLPGIVEDGTSFIENALKKARVISNLTGETVLADDSGLEVEVLGGAPGIHSARYAGENANDEMNIIKLMDNLKEIPPERRGATFRCVLVLYHPDGSCDSFEGSWEGRIAEEPAGEGGFGYDPVFLLPERGLTVAQLPPEVKNAISHRAQAFAKLRSYLRKIL